MNNILDKNNILHQRVGGRKKRAKMYQNNLKNKKYTA